MGALFDVGGGGASEFFFSAFDVRRGGRGGGPHVYRPLSFYLRRFLREHCLAVALETPRRDRRVEMLLLNIGWIRKSGSDEARESVKRKEKKETLFFSFGQRGDRKKQSSKNFSTPISFLNLFFSHPFFPSLPQKKKKRPPSAPASSSPAPTTSARWTPNKGSRATCGGSRERCGGKSTSSRRSL